MTKAFIHHSGWSVANTIANRRMYNKDLTNPGVGNARRQMDILNEREREKKKLLYTVRTFCYVAAYHRFPTNIVVCLQRARLGAQKPKSLFEPHEHIFYKSFKLVH